MKNKSFITSCLFSLAAVAQAQETPNIIFIYADDMGYGDLGCYGSKVNRTPNIDKLAAEGMRFTDFYSAATVSSPSRAALMTGRYAIRMGINDVFFPTSYTGIPETEVTMGEAMQSAGYYTGIIGKWHLGHLEKYLPLQNGFDEYFGIPYSNDMASAFFMRGNDVVDYHPKMDSITYVYTQEALRFLDQHHDKPFFLYLPHTACHVPLAASANFRGKSANGLYGDVVEELDWSVGKVLEKLDELKISENTIVIFSSDNGPWVVKGPMGGNPAPLFQGKVSVWEGGQRVPAIIRWPNKIKPQQVNTEVAAMIDWFPTLVSVVGGEIPNDRIIDGKNILPVLLGEGKRKDDEFAFVNYGQLQAYRAGDWKILLPEKKRKGSFWIEDVPAHDTLFFNLRKDIGENNDVKDKYPSEYQRVLEKMIVFKRTLKDVPPALIMLESNGLNMAANQQQEAIRQAREKGIKAKSK